MKNKKVLWISLIALDVAITVFLFVIHIIMLVNVLGANNDPDAMAALRSQDNLIGALMRDSVLYLVAFVIPLFVILAVNIIVLVFYVRKQTKKEPVQVNDLTDEQKEALKKELLKELQGDNKE